MPVTILVRSILSGAHTLEPVLLRKQAPFFCQEKSMNGKEALFKMTDLINTVIHALNDINADESNCVVSVLEQCIEYSNIIYEELDKKRVGE